MFNWLTMRLAQYIMVGLLVVLLGAIASTWYFKNQYAKALEEKGSLEVSLATQKLATFAAKQAVENWKASAENFQAVLAEMTKVQKEATNETRRLNETFTKHNLANLAKKKPGLIEARINNGTADMLKLLEDATSGLSTDGTSTTGKTSTTKTSTSKTD